MKSIKIELQNTKPFVSEGKFALDAEQAMKAIYEGTGSGRDFLGWLNLPNEIEQTLLDDINKTAQTLRNTCEVVVVVGIGGSYLGAKAVIESLSSSFSCYEHNNPKVVFAGQHLSEDYMSELTAYLRGKRFGIICISKSGTTTEPAVVFRILKKQLIDQEGKELSQELIVCITDRSIGALRELADKEGYKTFVIEDNVGGRFSVLTPVGLLPIAVAGFDITALVEGARVMREETSLSVGFSDNIAMQYAAVRNALYISGKKIEILANFNPKLSYIAEWWKQLYGESEGKGHRGIFPASVNFTSDLHSMGQWIQDGERSIFETVISVESPKRELSIPYDETNLDGLNFIAGKRIDHVNKMAEKGTLLAHVDGGVPNIRIVMPQINEYYIGQLLYFFEIACGVSAYILEVNPFDQPGVEDYKRNMFALLEKPGYEKETAEILKRI